MTRRNGLGMSSALFASGVGLAATDAPRLRYGGDAAFAPFESLDAQGRPRGFQIDLLAELGAELGVAFDITLQPWAQTEADFRQGRLDLLAMVETTPRRDWARFTRGHATPALAIYHRANRAAAQGLPDLVGLRIAVLDSEAMRDTLATWLSAVPGPFLRVADAGQALAAVQQGQADVALLPRAYADPLLASPAANGLTASRINLTLQSYAFGVAPGQAALQTQLQQGLDRLETNGRLEALRVRWLGSHRGEVLGSKHHVALYNLRVRWLGSHRGEAERALLEHDLVKERGWTWGVAGASGAALLLMGAGLWLRGRRIATERAGRAQAEGALRHAAWPMT